MKAVRRVTNVLLLAVLLAGPAACKREKPPPPAGQAAYDAAAAQVGAAQPAAGYGNTPAAKALAVTFSEALRGRLAKKSGAHGSIASYCQLSVAKLALVVRIPATDGMRREQRQTVIDDAWGVARQVAAKYAVSHEVIIALRGAIGITAVARGRLDGEVTTTSAQGIGAAVVYPFFAVE